MPAVWEMVKEAITNIGREASYAEIKKYVRDSYGEINDSSLTCSIISGSVNHHSRIHYQENKKPRICNGEHDFLFNTGRGRAIPYDPLAHGTWEIYEKEEGQLAIRIAEECELANLLEESDAPEERGLFALESHLRDYLAKNISKLTSTDSPLSMYISQDGRDGIEFQTDVGPIDILATDRLGNFVVIELKLGRGPDSALGQILRYMGWIDKHLANGKGVKGIIIASEIPKKLKYAASQTPNVALMEYALSFVVNDIRL